jgi:hypothetical protein
MEFYASVERGVEARRVPDAHTTRVEWREGGILSAKREYLRVGRKRLAFDICGAPFGTGFFVSWWLVEQTPSLLLILLVTFGLFLGALSALLVFGFLLVELSGFVAGILVLLLVSLVVMVTAFFLFGAAVSHDNTGWTVPILAIPYLGALMRILFQPVTYYRIDTMLMFQEMIHAAVLEAVDEMTAAGGIRSLSEAARRPIMREFFAR